MRCIGLIWLKVFGSSLCGESYICRTFEATSKEKLMQIYARTETKTKTKNPDPDQTNSKPDQSIQM